MANNNHPKHGFAKLIRTDNEADNAGGAGCLGPTPTKKIVQEIPQPELCANVKIRIQIEDTVNNRKLTDTEKRDILERAQEKYVKLEESVCRAKMPYVEEAAAEPGWVEGAPSTALMFQSHKLPANRRKKFTKLVMLEDANPNIVAKKDQNECFL